MLFVSIRVGVAARLIIEGIQPPSPRRSREQFFRLITSIASAASPFPRHPPSKLAAPPTATPSRTMAAVATSSNTGRAMLFCAICLLGAAASASGRELLQQPSFDECQAAFNAAGGINGISPNVRSCQQSGFNLAKCCVEAKAALNQGPPNCLCNPEVWASIENQISSAGINNVNAATLRQFASFCNIKFAGNGC